jgi:Tol biopolymer transport system component
MSLTPGTRLGGYEIIAELGRGGMGEVYRARDAKLNRDVALKVLPDLLASDGDRLARFRREAQVLAALNHPNIAHIHGFEDSGPAHALVLELVEGPTLADRLAAGPIALGEAIPIARQIADALEAAHDQGIVHRDLKPANVKVREDGTVKVLDFGLAKALDPTDPASAASVSNSPTLTARATQLGLILGTAAYMAPEQARGRVVDRRADIWAFGVVLYETLSGQRAFEGDDVSITLASVLKEDVKWEALPADLPAAIRRLLRRCLEKDPKRRLSAIGDARLELDEPHVVADTATTNAAPARAIGKERWIWASVTGLAVVAAAAVGLGSSRTNEVSPPLTRFSVAPVGEGGFMGPVPRFALSPDGQSLVFSATVQAGKAEQLWLRRLDSVDVRPIPGTQGAPGAEMPQSPFWSPDGRYLGFFVQTLPDGSTGDSRLRVVDLQGGAVQPWATLPSNNASGSWNSDGVILVSSQATNGVQRLPVGGGVPVQVTTLNEESGEIAHLFPQFLPDGRRFIFQARTKDRRNWATFVGSLDSGERTMVVHSDYARFAAPNILLYVRDDNLLAQRMDATTLALTGEAVQVAAGVSALATNGRAAFSVSNTGGLAHSANPNPDQISGTPSRQLTWFDRSGKALGTVGSPVSASRLRLSPDGKRVALLEFAPSTPAVGIGALWVADLGRTVKAPLMPANILVTSPTWSADGTRLLFGSRADATRFSMTERASSGATPARLVHEQADENVVPLDESSDGAFVVFAAGKGGLRSLQVLSRADGKRTTYMSGPFDYAQASLSRDGKWLAYASNESSRYEIVVQPFPDPSKGKWPISTSGGTSPRWRGDGRELFYVDAEQRLMAVPITASRELAGRPAPLFVLPTSAPRNIGGAAYLYDVTEDGLRFLVAVPTTTTSQVTPLTVTTNWMSLLKK